MTRDEILAMVPGPELDALVAEKVMGLEVYRSKEDWKQKRMPHIAEWSNMVPYPAYWHPVYELATVISTYSTDMNEAWGVYLKMMNGPFSQRKRFYQELQDLTRDGERVVAWPDVLTVLRGVMTESICKAALLTMEGNPELLGTPT